MKRAPLPFYSFLYRCTLVLLWATWLAPTAVSRAQTPAFGPALAVGVPLANGQSVVNQSVPDGQGNLYVAGSFAGTVSFGAFTLVSRGLQDVFVAKLDGTGNYLWAVQGGGNGTDGVSGVAVDASGVVFVTGSFTSATATFGGVVLSNPATAFVNYDLFVATLDAGSGLWGWAVRAGGDSNDTAQALALDGVGNAYVGGAFNGATATFGPFTVNNAVANPANVSDMFVAKISGLGVWQWVRAGGGGGYDAVNDLAVDAAHDVYLTGLVQSSSPTFGPFSLPPTIISNADDILVAKLDASGTWLWVARAGGAGTDEGHGIAVDASGNAYVTGRFTSATPTFGPYSLRNLGPGAITSSNDAFVAKLNGTGAWLWAVRAGSGIDQDNGWDLAFDAGANRLAVVGTFASPTADFGPFTLSNSSSSTADTYLAYLSPDGTWLGAVSSQGPGDESARRVGLDANGEASVAGYFQGTTAAFGSAVLASSGTTTQGFVTLVPGAVLLRVVGVAPSSGAPGQTVTVTGNGFVGVTAVSFNGLLAPSFAVQSATQLTAVVPVGVTAGPVRVRTAAGAGSSPTAFTPTALSSTVPTSRSLPLSPNPATHHVLVPGLPAGTHVQLVDAMGRVARETTVSAAAEVSVLGLAPGLYTLCAADARGQRHSARVAVE